MKKFTTTMGKFGDILEIVLSIFVALAAVAAVISFVPDFFGMMADGLGLRELSEVLEEILTVVIAVEFLKMLLKPTSLTVIEVLIFLIARHMILQQTTPTQDLISVIGICLLLAAKLIIGHYKKYQTLPGIGRRAEGKESFSRQEKASQGEEQAKAGNPALPVDLDQPERAGRESLDRRTYHDVVRELDKPAKN